MSEKYDGQRAIWTGKQMVSRIGTIISIPKWLRNLLSKFPFMLDGELYFGRGKFGLTGLFRSSDPDNEMWKKAMFMVFDIPSITLKQPLFKRLEKIRRVISDIFTNYPKLHIPIQIVKYIPIKSTQHTKQYFEKITASGGEGLILRNPFSYYENGLSRNMLKYKPFEDCEAKIIGYKIGNGKFSGMLGSFQVILLDKQTIKFGVSGMPLSIRQNYMDSHPIGTIITVCYTELTKTGKPRFPRYKGIRHDIIDSSKPKIQFKPRFKIKIKPKRIQL